MKVTLFLVVGCAFVALISSERCHDDADCTHETCDDSTRRGCSHGECTCLVAANAGTCLSAKCSARADCDSCQCRDSHAARHCFDDHCLCGRGFGPGVGK